MNSIKIDSFELKPFSRAFIIAELSANHNGSLETAIETVRAAKRAGADAIKLQTFTADTLTLNIKNNDFKIDTGTSWDGRYLYDLYQEAYTPWEWHKVIFAEAKKLGLTYFSSPFDNSAVDFLEELSVPAYKIASPEITDVPLIKYAASKGKPIIISTGMATENEIKEAIEACLLVNNPQIVVLKCTSEYPAKLEDANLIMIKEMREKFRVLTGLSDHTLGYIAPVSAVCLGACVIEKHFTIEAKGIDAGFSLNEKEFTAMSNAVRDAELSIGSVNYDLSESINLMRKYLRSLYICEDVKAGDMITMSNVRSVRPGFGLEPKYLDKILGAKFADNFIKGSPLSFDKILKG